MSRRITLVIQSLEQGGAERVLSSMANYWADHGQHVTLLTLDDGSVSPFYPLHPTVTHRALGVAGPSPNVLDKARDNVRRVLALRRALVASRPDVAISRIDRTNVLTILAARRLGVPVIVSETNDPYDRTIGRGWEELRRLTYPLAGCVVVQSEHSRGYYPASIQRRIRVIPNPIFVPPDLRPVQQSEDDSGTVTGMGRLVPVKRFDLLIRGFARVAADHPRWDCLIWGEGPERSRLQALIDALNLADRIRLPGRTADPFGALQQADLFVLSSRAEGFSNVLCEAMASGLAVISTDVAGGRAIVRDGVDGLLIPPGDEGALAAALETLMSDRAERARLAAAGSRILERFGIDRIMPLWEDAIDALKPGRG